MAKQSINLGSSANDGTGTTLRAGGDIVNDNFDELYTAIGTGSNLQITVSGASNGQALIYSSSNSRFEPANQSGGLSDIVGDTSPQLGGNLDVNGNSIISASNGNIEITPNGSGKVILDGLNWPTSDGSTAQFLQTDGSAQLQFATVLQNVAEDTSPQLGANLDVQTNEITTSTSNGNIKLNPNGTGVVEVKGDGSSADGTIQLNCSQNSHGIKLASPPHSAAQSYTLTFPQTAPAANKLIQTDGSGNLSFSSDLTIDSLTMSGSGNVTFTAATTLALNANTGGTVVVNDGSNNADFRVESDNNANMLFVDAGSDHVNIGTSSDLGGVLNVSGTGVFQTADNTDTLSLISTDADDAIGANLRIYRNSASPANADNLGTIDFEGRNNNSQDVVYAQIVSQINDVTDGAEDGILSLKSMIGGTSREGIRISDGGVVVNELSHDIDFRVESNGSTNMLFVDGGNDEVVIQKASSGATATSGSVLIVEDDDNAELSILGGSSSVLAINFGHSGDADDGIISYNTTAGSENMAFTVNAAQRFLIRDSGAVHIDSAGESTGGGAEAYAAYITNAQATNANGIYNYFDGGAPDTGSTYFMVNQDTSTNRCIIFANGNLGNHDNSYGAISDERIKQDITDVNSQWDDIKNLKVRNFKMKDDIRAYGGEAEKRIGLIAQEAETVSPGLIQLANPSSGDINSDASFGTLYTSDDVETQGDNPTAKVGDVKEIKEQVKHIKYSILYMKAIKALQEAQTRIETLETKVAALEG